MTATKKKTKKQIDREQAAAMPLLPGTPSERIISDARAVIEKKDPKIELQAKALTELSQSEGWALVKEYLLNRGQRLLRLTRDTNRASRNFADSGFAFTIYDQVAAADEALINLVENPTKLKAFERDEDSQDDADDSDL